MLGLAGYVLATVATAQLLMVAWVELFVIPWVSLQMPALADAPPPGVEYASMLMQGSLAVGYFVLGLAVYRANVLNRGASLLLMIAAPFFGLGDVLIGMVMANPPELFFVGSTLFAVSLGGLGASLALGTREARLVKPARLAQAIDMTASPRSA